MGMTDTEIHGITEGPGAPCWDLLDSTLLRAVDELLGDAAISDGTWGVLRDNYDDLQLIEVPVVVGQYQLVAYFNNTMRVEVDPELPGLPST
jgi:hypothetical protein